MGNFGPFYIMVYKKFLNITLKNQKKNLVGKFFGKVGKNYLQYCSGSVKNVTFLRDSFSYNEKMDILKMSKKFNFENPFSFFLHFLPVLFF